MRLGHSKGLRYMYYLWLASANNILKDDDEDLSCVDARVFIKSHC